MAGPAAGQAPHRPAAQRQREARGRVQRLRRRPAEHQDARPPVEAADRRPRRAAVRLVQLEESDVFVSQPGSTQARRGGARVTVDALNALGR